MTPRELAIASLVVVPTPLKLTSSVLVKCRGCGKICQKQFKYVTKCCRNSNRLYACSPCTNRDIMSRPETIAKITASNRAGVESRRQSLKRLWNNPEYRAKITKSSIAQAEREHQHRRTRAVTLWADPAYRKMVCDSLSVNRVPRSKSPEQFVIDAVAVHGQTYDYSGVVYEHCEKHVVIKCNKCGRSFEQLPMVHLRGSGCPTCPVTISRGHQRICDQLTDWGINYTINDHSLGFEVDILIPKYNLAIEYHGLYWHSYCTNETTAQRCAHARKADGCDAAGIQLLQFFEHERPELIDDLIRHKLRLTTTRIHARKCGLTSDFDGTDFFANNHLAGYNHADRTIGLTFGGETVAAMSFKNRGDRGYEIMRFACRAGSSVVGAASRLVKAAGYDRLFTYADRRFSIGGVYRAIGMKQVGVTRPGYFYTKNGKVWSRIKFQKHKLARLLDNFDPALTEAENMFNNGYRRLWDAGHLIFVL